MKDLTDEQKIRMINLYIIGWTQQSLAAEFQCSVAYVSQLLNDKTSFDVTKEKMDLIADSKNSSKLSKQDVKDISSMLRRGIKQCVIAKEFGVLPSTISHLKNSHRIVEFL